jgi:hypothetical protein
MQVTGTLRATRAVRDRDKGGIERGVLVEVVGEGFLGGLV